MVDGVRFPSQRDKSGMTKVFGFSGFWANRKSIIS